VLCSIVPDVATIVTVEVTGPVLPPPPVLAPPQPAAIWSPKQAIASNSAPYVDAIAPAQPPPFVSRHGVVLLPPIQPHSLIEGLNSQRSFRVMYSTVTLWWSFPWSLHQRMHSGAMQCSALWCYVGRGTSRSAC
jgi:hypothetical protein